MPTMQQSIITVAYYFSDPAAATNAVLPPLGLPDVADITGIVMPFAGTIVGVSLNGAPAAGDTVAVVPTIANNNAMAGITSCASLTTTITNAVPGASTIVTKDQADAQFAAGQFVGVKYTTTTGGTYTVKDILVVLYISTGRTDI